MTSAQGNNQCNIGIAVGLQPVRPGELMRNTQLAAELGEVKLQEWKAEPLSVSSRCACTSRLQQWVTEWRRNCTTAGGVSLATSPYVATRAGSSMCHEPHPPSPSHPLIALISSGPVAGVLDGLKLRGADVQRLPETLAL